MIDVGQNAYQDLEWLETPTEPEGYRHGYQSYPCLFQPKKLFKGKVNDVHEARNLWMEELQKVGISTRPATHAVHMLSFYSQKYGLKKSDFPMARIANDCSISLPLFHGMTEPEQNYVIDRIRNSSALNIT